jgi:NAD(P) transhydrogenase subunit alpha
MKIAVPRERRPGERRVAATPETVRRLLQLGFRVAIESDAGARASFGDDDYQAAGAEIVKDARQLWQDADIARARPGWTRPDPVPVARPWSVPGSSR